MSQPTKPTPIHYVDNAAFYQACLEYRNVCKAAELDGKPKPRIPDYIGSCLLKIANKLSYSRNFIGYPYREEMIGDGIENCILYFHNFNPDKYKNPFAYFTQIIYYAFLRRIHREKKQMYVRHKVMLNQATEGLSDSNEYESSDEFGLSIDSKMTDNDYMNDFVNTFEQKALERREARREKKGVEKFLDDKSEEEPLSIEPEVE